MDLLGRTLAAAVMAFVILLLASTSSEAASTSGKCKERGRTISSNSVARLYTSGPKLIGCMWSRGERVALDTEYDDDYTLSHGWSSARLGGRFAVWIHHEEDVSCKAECPPGYRATRISVMFMDLRTRLSASKDSVPAGSTLRVNRRGVVTWLEGLGGGRRAVHAWDRDGHRVLDTGSIRSASYSLRGNVLRWTNGDASHVVTLR